MKKKIIKLTNPLNQFGNNARAWPSVTEWVRWLMGAGESIQTVALSWDVVTVSSKNMWCVSRRHNQCTIYQAVSSVAPLVCQSSTVGFYLYNREHCALQPQSFPMSI